MKTYKGLIKELPPNGIFVFGSNTEGRHGAGNAWVAKQLFGAKYGQPRGLQGQSYGIVTTDLTRNKRPSYPSRKIRTEVCELYRFAKDNASMEFYVAYTGGGTLLSGFTHQEMANMFNCAPIPGNIVFEEEFAKLMGN